MDEFEIIAKIFAPLAAAPGAFGLMDDAAIIPARPGHDLVVTTDQIAEGTDFFPGDLADLVARKALRVNLSDLAAKGAEPAFYLLNLALPSGVSMDWLKRFAAGLAQDQDRFGVSLLGGDTSRSDGPLSIAVTAFGFTPEGRMLKRSAASPGDAVYVTGTIGDSGGGLAVLKGEDHAFSAAQRDYLAGRYRVPEPPVAFGARLRWLAGAAVDISDGLVADLGHVARASGMKIVLDAAALPRSDALRALWGDSEAAIVRAATAGDDYQIAFTANPVREIEIDVAAKAAGIKVTRIGAVQLGEGVVLMRGGEEVAVPHSGYRHF